MPPKISIHRPNAQPTTAEVTESAKQVAELLDRPFGGFIVVTSQEKPGKQFSIVAGHVRGFAET